MMANFSVKRKWHDFLLLEYEFAWFRNDQESVGVMLCLTSSSFSCKSHVVAIFVSVLTRYVKIHLYIYLYI